MQIRFGDFVLDVGRRQLSQSGAEVPLQPQAFDLLVYLIENRDRVATKDEIFEHVWADQIVTESALSFSVKSVRKALGDDRRPRRFVETIHGRGFRFIAECSVDRAVSAPGPAEDSRSAEPAAATPPSLPKSATPFVGRARELEQLKRGLEAAAAGDGSAFWLLGDPGIGKTRLAAELFGEATGHNVQVLAGRCHDQGAPSLWPWAQIVRSYLRAQPGQVAEALGAGAGDIVRLVPSVREHVPDLEPISAVFDAEQERLRLFNGLVEFLGRAARRQPLALWLEDLHWADAASILLLRLLAEDLGSLPILVVGSYRSAEADDNEPLAELRKMLERETWSRELSLGGLPADTASELVRSVSPVDLEDDWRERVVERAEGNPYFLQELCRDLDEQSGDRDATLPGGIRDAIDRRLSRIAPQCRAVLTVGALIGREFELDVLRAASGRPLDEVIAEIEAGVAAHLIDEAEDNVIRFSHALVQEELRRRMSRLRRATLHVSIAEALLAAKRDEVQRIAHHFAHGVPVDGWQRAYEHLLRAADAATNELSFDDSARLYEAAMALRPETAPLDAETHITLLVNLGTAQRNAGRQDEAVQSFREALDVARDAGLNGRFAEVALALRWRWAVRDDETTAVLDEALSRIESSADPIRSRVQSALACGIYAQEGMGERCRTLIDDALSHARASGNTDTLLHVLEDCQLPLWAPANVEERLSISTEQLDLSRSVGSPEMELQAATWHIGYLAEQGELGRARELLREYTANAERVGLPRFLWSAYSFRAAFAYLDGQLDAAEEYTNLGVKMGERPYGESIALLVWACHLWTIRIAQGRFEEFAPTLLAFGADLGDVVDPTWIDLVQIHVHLLDDDLSAAERLYRPLADADFATLPPVNALNGLRPLTYAAIAATGVGDARGAARLYEMLAPYSGRWVVFGIGAIIVGALDVELGALAATAGDLERAERHLENALAAQDRAGARLPSMCARLELAEVLLRREARDQARIRRLIEEVSEAAAAVGHVALAPRIASIEARL